MAITKINTIKNVGRFKNCGPSNNDVFGKFTFIYADNGSGKTTFCNIMRSLKTGNDIFLRGRKTLGSDEEIFVSLSIDGRTVNYQNGAWSEQIPDIEIFDDTYIYENVHATDGITHDHKKNLYQVIIGSEGVSLAKVYETLDAEARSVAEQIRQLEATMMRGVPQSIAFKQLIKLSCPDDVDLKIAEAEKELVAIRELETLKRRTGFATINLPTIPSNLENVLAETIVGVAKDVSDKVASHISEHNMQGRGEQWISEGLSYRTKTCPFCEQDLNNSTFIPVLEGFFSESYNLLKQKIARMQTEISTLFSEAGTQHIRHTYASNVASVDFWVQYCKISLPPLDISTIETSINSLRQYIGHLIQTKSQSVLEPVSFDEQFKTIIYAYSELISIVDSYNSAVASANQVIDDKKRSLGSADIVAAQLTLDKLRIAKELHHGELSKMHTSYNELGVEWDRLDKAKKEARLKLDTYTETVVTKYQSSINKILESFNAGFKITNTAHDYRGTGTPRTTFEIEINGVAISPGDSNTPLDQPSFKNTLSAGDKSTLAFAFFWAQLQSKADLSNSIIVLDDPFSSQDGVRRTSTAIKTTRSSEVINASQVILLSHDVNFLRHARGCLTETNIKHCTIFGILGDSSNYSIINPYSLDSTAQIQYTHDKVAVQLYLNENEGKDLDIIRTLRPLLEGYYKTHFPSLVKSTDTLGDITSNIRSVGQTHPLFNVVEQLEEVNIYTRPYHHGSEATQQPAPINSSELRGTAVKVLAIIGAS